MPRSTRDSEEEVDPKPGRKTRLTDVVSVDSPLRRSSRIKSVKQNESSPESISSDTSNVSNTQTRVTRRRTGTMDSTTTTEKQRSLRSRMNSVSSDVSEITENDTNTMTPTKRNRNSIMGDVLNKTSNRRSTRFTRAGSESKTSPRRVTRNTRATSMEPESGTENKRVDRNESELTHTPNRIRRRTLIVPSEATVVEEKDENMKVLVVTLDRKLPNVSEVKETDLNDSLKSAQKHDSMSNAEDNLDSSYRTVNKQSTENITEKSPSKSPEDVEKDISTNDNNTVPDNDKKSEENEDLLAHTVTETESSVHNLSQSFSQKADQDTSKELGLQIENLLSTSMEKHEDFSNKENLAANVTNIENTDSNTALQSPKPLSVSNSNKLIKEKCKSPCNLSSRSRHSRSTESMDDINIDNDVANDSVFENAKDTDAPDNTPKLAVETDSLSEPILNISSDKNVTLKISSDLSSCESLELVQCLDDVMTTDDEKLTETNTTLNKDTTKIHNEESNKTANDSTVSSVEKAMNANEESEKDNMKSNTSMNDQDDVKEEVNKLNTSGNVQNDDGISFTNTCSTPNLTNTVPLISPDNTSAANTKCSPIFKNKEASELKSINKTNTSSPNTNSAKSINADEDSVTDVVKSSPSSTVTETPSELAEEVSKKEESANDSLTLKNKPTEKSGSDEQKSESIQETCNKNQEIEAVEDNDSNITATNLFQDIPAAEWKEKNADADKDSIHSMSTERLENEMEAECDLVLIDKEAWLAAENIKAAKEKEAFDYDSDDTVLLKMQSDYIKARNEKMKMNKSVDKMNVTKDATTNENDIDNEATNTNNFKDETENENQDKSIKKKSSEHSTSKHNVSNRKSLERKSLNESHKTTEAEENLSESITKKRKSLNKSTSKADVSRKSLNNSNQKAKETSEGELNSERVISTSARKDKEKRSLNISSKKQRNRIEESDNESKESSIFEKTSNVKKKFSRKRSAVRTIESDSDDSKSDSGDSENKTIELPNFMLDEASNTDSNESDKSMDSDIEKEYNLGGKDISKFSDDDVRGDECRASETESSDPEDNGSDLEDFIVDDVEEDEESEEEGGKVNEDIEIEELHTDEDTEENQGKEIQEQHETMIVQEPDESEDKIKEVMIEEESQNENEQENIEENANKLLDTSSKQKSKLEISDRLSTSQTSRKKKLKKVDTSQSEKNEKENSLSNLSLSNSLKNKTTKQKKRAPDEFMVEDIELPLNDSQPISNKQIQELSNLVKCSTPKSHYLPKSDKFDVSIKTLNTNDDKINTSLDKEKIEDTSLKTKDNLKKLGKIKSKENLVDKRLSYGLEELLEKTKFSKPLSPKMTNLNKTHSIPDSDTPTTKYLRKDKLNDSAPVLNMDTEFKKLVDADGNDEQNNALNQLEEESEDVNTPNSETVPELNTSLKQKVLSVAENILEADRQKKHKKRKQTAKKSNTTILIEDSFLEDIDSQIVSKDENVVSTLDADKNKKVEEVSLNEEKKKKKKEKKKKKKITHTDINKDVEEEVLHEEITDTKSEITKKPKKIKKKQEKEVTENLPCSGNQVSGKKKKKISEVLLNEELTTTKISKKTQKLLKDIAVQEDETAVQKLPKKKKQLVSEDTSSKLSKKEQNLSSNDTPQDKNVSTKKLSKKRHKLVEKDTESEVQPVKKSNKQQSTDIVSASDEGSTVVKFFEAREEALKAVKCTTDSIKVNKKRNKKKQKDRMQEVELENEKPKPKKRKIKDKTESTKGIKRLSDEFLEILSDAPTQPQKKRKLSKIKDQILPSRTMFDSKPSTVENIYVEEDIEPVSSCGSTTQFAVVNIQKMKKKKKIPGVVSFKQKMIARNSRQPVSAYLMYLEKQKVAGKDKFCNKPY